MRENKAKDYWSKLSKSKSTNYCATVNLYGLNGLDEIKLSTNMQIICGLNGVGKTTVLSSVKDILGIELTDQDLSKIGENKITGKIVFDGEEYDCENESGKRLVDQVECINQIHYYDYFSILRILDFLWKQENFEELLEQNEPTILDCKELENINYLIGKSYQCVTVTLIEEIEELGSIPFFEVCENGVEYDSRKMGIGEYSLLYLYLKIRTNENSIMIIEEPESFIAIQSQMKLMNLICERIVRKNNSFIISTHSPYIIKNVNEENIKIIDKALGYTVVNSPNNNKATGVLGFEEDPQGVFYVEDEMAKDFLELFLAREKIPCRSCFEVQKAGGSGEISQILKLTMLNDMRYSIIGIYDEDQKDIVPKDVSLPYLILPPIKDVETSMIALLKSRDNFEEISRILRLEKEELIGVFSKIQGKDRHDWIDAFLKEVGLQQKQLLVMLYDIWRRDNEDHVERFSEELRQIVDL